MTDESDADPSWPARHRSEVSREWRDLAAANQFLAVRDDLALIVSDPKHGLTSKRLIKRIDALKQTLTSAGHDDAAVAVATVGFTPEMESDLFEAGAHIVRVPIDFFTSENDEQRARAFDALLPEDQSLPTFSPMSSATIGIEDNRAAYDGPSPFLAPEEIDEWKKIVENDAISE